MIQKNSYHTNREEGYADTLPLYGAITTVAGNVVSFALACPTGIWFYSEVVDVECEASDDAAAAAVAAKLRKVPGTTFVKGADLGHEAVSWLARQQRAPLLVRVEDGATRDLMIDLLGGEGRQNPQWSICRFSHAKRDEFFRHCGGPSKLRHHSLVNSLALAVCDLQRSVPMDSARINHLEMLMGTKGAVSYRAWTRRHEACNPRVRTRSHQSATV